MRLVFAGTPEAAVPSLRALLESPEHEVLAVVTRPDAVAGRGRRVSRSPVGLLADEHGIEVLQPARPDEPGFVARMAELAPDCCPIVAYGALIREPLLNAPPHGWVNLHFSLLPAWRGAAPVQAAIAAGDEITGATAFRLDAGLDTGPVLGVVTETVRPTDTSGDLLGRLSEVGAELLVRVMDGLEAGVLSPVPQSADGVSHAEKISTEDARVDWTAPAAAVDRRIRAVTPAPGAWTEIDGRRVKLGPVRIVDPVAEPHLADLDLAPGEIEIRRKGFFVGTATAAVRLGEAQPPGKKMMQALDWARGARFEDGVRAE